MEALKTQFKQVLLDLQTALHCHGCGEYIRFGDYRYAGEYCSKGCWDPCRSEEEPCTLKTAFGHCRWCTDYTFQPYVFSQNPAFAQETRMMRALDAFLYEHDELPYEAQYRFRTREYCLFANKPEDFVARWYWAYVFGTEPRTGTLPADWLTYKPFMPLERRATDAEWPFYDSCYS